MRRDDERLSGNPHPHPLPFRARERRSLWSTALLFLAFFLLPLPAMAVRAVPWIPGRTVVIKLKVGQTTEILFPQVILSLTPPGGGISYDFTNRRIILKAKRSFEPARFFVTDEKANSYLIELQEAQPGDKEDDSVELSPELAEAAPAAVTAGPNQLMLDLFSAMRHERPLAGFTIIPREMEPFSQDTKHSAMRLKTLYDGALLQGLIVEVENVTPHAIRVNPQQFSFDGIIAASTADFFLAPSEPETTIEAFKGYPKKTTAYLVLSKARMKK